MQSYAPRQLSVVFRQKKAAIRCGIVARKPSQFLLEVLKAEIDAERLRILQKQFADLCDLRSRFRLPECKSRDGPGYPMSMPPFTLST